MGTARVRDVAQIVAVAFVACALLAITLIATPVVDAQSSFNDDRVTFGGVNGKAATVRAVGDQVWVGGEFTQAFDADLVTTHVRDNVAVFDFNTGDVLPIALNTNAKIKAVESDDATTVWIAGNFTEIAGQPLSFIAAIDVFTGQINADFSVVVDYPVNSLHYNDGSLYLGGEFGQINGLYYNKMARVDAITGQVDTSFRANPNGIVRSIDTYGDRVYAAGLFEEVGKAPDNVPRRWISGFDEATGLPAGPDFPFLALRPGEGAHKAGLWRVHVSPDGNHIYTADQRNFIIKWDRLTGQKLWSREAEGDIQAIAVEGNTVYLGTHDGFLAKNDQRLLFALTDDGFTDNGFVPLQNSFIGTLELDLSQGALIAVGDFTTVNDVASPHLAVFHGPDWNGASPLVPPQLPGDVTCDDRLNVADALVIAQFSVGTRTQVQHCPLSDPVTEIGPGADVNNNGVVNVADALIVAQCAVGITNVLCPEG